jgi:putative membrane protein
MSIRQTRPLLFGVALLTLVVAFGPVERFAAELFWVHMVQHVLLLTVVAPLLVLSAPWMSMMRLRPAGLLRRVATPTAVWIAFNVNLVVWHVPALFDLTLRNAGVHALEHVLFLATGVLFWAQVIDVPLLRKRLDDRARVVYISTAAVVSWGLSFALTVAPSALYSAYARAAARPGGLTALGDQRIAASVMLVPGSITFLIAGLVFVHRWLDDEQREVGTRIMPSHKEQPA